MRDETLIEPFAVTEIFVDGVADQHTVGGIFSVAFYRLQPGGHEECGPQKVVVARLIMRAADVPAMQAANRCALNAPGAIANAIMSAARPKLLS